MWNGAPLPLQGKDYLDRLCARRFLRMRFFFHFHLILPFFLNFLGRLPIGTPVKLMS
jgi:hypothetical protein